MKHPTSKDYDNLPERGNLSWLIEGCDDSSELEPIERFLVLLIYNDISMDGIAAYLHISRRSVCRMVSAIKFKMHPGKLH
jgi:DNA-directed RNA polymerase specialized sigma subunit